MTLQAILFDFDGVVVESLDVKTDAFRALFASQPAHLPAILEFHRANSGLSRFEKFELIYRDILHRPLPPEVKDELGRRFADLVVEQVVACPLVPGALEFLQAHATQTPLFLASGTPEDEVREILRRRDLAKYFREAYGAPRDKADVIVDILQRYRWRPDQMLFVGDAVSDWQAAVQTDIAFVGRVAESDQNPFPPAIPNLRDLFELETYWTRMAGANS